MLAQIKFAIADIRDHIIRYIINFVQILICLVLIAFAIKTTDELNGFLDNIDYLKNTENVYIMTDVTDYEHYNEMTENPEYIPKLKEFVDYLRTSEEFDRYLVYEYYLYFEDSDTEAYFCDRSFTDMYNLKTDDGTKLSDIMFSDYGDYTPVIFSSSYKSRHHVGDILKTDRGDVIVAGFLAPGSYYYDLAAGKERIYFGSSVLCPLMLDKTDDVVDYLCAIERTHIITDDPQALNSVSAKSDELGLYKFSFKSLQTQVENIINDEREDIQGSLFIVILIISLCVSCMITFLLTFVDDHLREFAINLLSGATLSQIVLRVVVQVGLPIVFANFAAFLLYKNSTISLWIFIISVMLCCFVAAVPAVKLYRLGINGILKRCE